MTSAFRIHFLNAFHKPDPISNCVLTFSLFPPYLLMHELRRLRELLAEPFSQLRA